MIYLQVDLQKWIERYDLEIQIYNCPKCKKAFKTEVPIMTKDSVGLQSHIHECGSQYWTVILTPRTAEAKMFWDTII